MAQTGREKTVRAERVTAPKVLRARPAAAKELAADEVARRAYEHFVARGYQHGHDVEDWLRAEAELAAR
jgi:hypothetical protein